MSLQDEGIDSTAKAADINTNIAPAVIKGATTEKRSHNIPDFLNRLYQIDNFQWVKTDVKGKVLKTYRFPEVLLAQAPIRDKISNFYGLRAGVELVVLVNNQKFQAGNLMVSFLPNAKYNLAKMAMHGADLKGLVTRSGAPRANLDLMDGTRISMSVPYASPFVFYNLLTSEGTIGDFHISVYSVLRDVAASGTVSVRVYARFIDVDLEFPTGELPATNSQMPSLTRAIESLDTKPTRAKLDVAKKEIQSILDKIDKGEFSFQMNTNSGAFKQKALPKMASSNDDNLTHMLSTHSKNSLKSMNMGDASTNEMSFNKMLTIPCYYDSFDVTTAQAADTNVWLKTVSPLVGPNITNADSSISADYLYFHSNLYKKWRGSIIYRFRAVKTRFHSVRLRVWFSPGSAGPTASINRNACYSKIIDLEVENSFTFEVPYVHPYEYLNTRKGATSLGRIGIDIENPMVAPDTVESTIEIVVDRFAGEDFQCALPSSMIAFPFNPTVRTSKVKPKVTPRPLRQPPNLSFQMNTEAAFSSADVKLRVVKPIFHMSNAILSSSAYRGLLSGAWIMSGLPWYSFFPQILLAEIALLGTLQIAHSIYSKMSLFKKDLTREGIHPNPGPSFAQTGTSSSDPLEFTSPYLGVQKLQLNLSSEGSTPPPVNPQPVVETFDLGSSIPFTFTCQNSGFVYINSVRVAPEITMVVDGMEPLLVLGTDYSSTHTPVYVNAGTHSIDSTITINHLIVSVYPVDQLPTDGISFDVANPSGILTVTDPVHCLPGVVIPNASSYYAALIVNGINTVNRPQSGQLTFFGANITYLGPGDYHVQFKSSNSSSGTARIGFALTGAAPTLATSSFQPLLTHSTAIAPLTSSIEDSSNQFTGDLTTGGPYTVNFDNPNVIPSLTFTPSVATQYDLIWSTDLVNAFHYQMNNPEQDMERTGFTDENLINPMICKNMSQYCIGNSMAHINQMTGRSTLYDQITPIDSRTIHIMPHGIGICDKDAGGLVQIGGTDNISYYGNAFSFARGSVNFRLQTTGAPYRVLIDPNNDIDQTANQSFNLLEQSGDGISSAEELYSSNLIQQSINTGVEGFGEFAVPFYSSTYCYSINPQYNVEIGKAVTDFTHPDTHTLIFPQGNLSDVIALRNAGPDFEFSYLSGPPLLLPILP